MPKTVLLNSQAEACYYNHGLVVNFGNIRTKQKWHDLNPPIKRET